MIHKVLNYSLTVSILVSTPVIAADSRKNADAIITIKNSAPCFSYRQDGEVKQNHLSFDYLHVTSKGSSVENGWEIQIANPDKKGLLDPNTTRTCVMYGVLNPGMETIQSAKPLLFDTPYEVLIRVSTTSSLQYEQRYNTDFCISKNSKGETILLSAYWDDQNGKMKCLKPGESKSRGFWGWLFGK